MPSYRGNCASTGASTCVKDYQIFGNVHMMALGIHLWSLPGQCLERTTASVDIHQLPNPGDRGGNLSPRLALVIAWTKPWE